MADLWIVHREARARAALERLAAAPDCLAAPPDDPRLEREPAPRVVILGVEGDLEAELEFAHRTLPRTAAARWVLVAPDDAVPEAERLFDALDAEVLPWPPPTEALRRRVADALARRSVDPLSARRARDAVASRFRRWLRDVSAPELLAALDPRLGDVPVLVAGEPGTGRGVVARYVHWFGPRQPGTSELVTVAGRADLAVPMLLCELARSRGAAHATLCVEEVDLLPEETQRALLEWIELGPPAHAVPAPRIRWVATAGDPHRRDPPRSLLPALRERLAGLAIHIPPLRARREHVPQLATELAAAWCEARGARPRRFSDDALAALADHPWPGNVRELEAVVVRTLAAVRDDPIPASKLRFEAFPPRYPSAPAPEPAWPEAAPRPGAEPVTAPPAESEAEAAPTEAPEGAPAGAGGLAGREPVREPAPEAAGEETERLLERLGPLAEEEPTTPPGGPGARGLLGSPSEPELETELETEAPATGAGDGSPPPIEAEPAPGARPRPAAEPDLRRVAGALAERVRGPLRAIRALAARLPDRYADAGFREAAVRELDADAERIEQVVERLARFAELPEPEPAPVNVAALLERMLEKRRHLLEARRMLVLEEIDRDEPFAWADPEQLAFAFDTLLERVVELVPERGDLYVASRRHEAGPGGLPCVRVLIRFEREPGAAETADASLEIPLAESVIRAQGGTVTVDLSQPREGFVLVDLPAPRPEH